MMTYWRKRLKLENGKETLDRSGHDGDDDNNSSNGENNIDTTVAKPSEENRGKLILDATCAPADIHYPTDLRLLNEAREKLEKIIDTSHAPLVGLYKKTRTYRNKARKEYLNVKKLRKPSIKKIRKAIGKQLRFIRRDIKIVEELAVKSDLRLLSGKASAEVEFGAKLAISLVDGYADIEALSWDSFNEGNTLIEAIEAYRQRYGYFPEAVLADKIYRNRDNLRYCKKNEIRLSGPRLGRPSHNELAEQRKIERLDASERNAVEGKFGEGKRCYGLSRIMARLQCHKLKK